MSQIFKICQLLQEKKNHLLTAAGLPAWKQTLLAVKGIHLAEDEELKWASLWSCVVRPRCGR